MQTNRQTQQNSRQYNSASWVQSMNEPFWGEREQTQLHLMLMIFDSELPVPMMRHWQKTKIINCPFQSECVLWGQHTSASTLHRDTGPWETAQPSPLAFFHVTVQIGKHLTPFFVNGKLANILAWQWRRSCHELSITWRKKQASSPGYYWPAAYDGYCITWNKLTHNTGEKNAKEINVC